MICSGHGHLCLTGCRNSAPVMVMVIDGCDGGTVSRLVRAVRWGSMRCEVRRCPTSYWAQFRHDPGRLRPGVPACTTATNKYICISVPEYLSRHITTRSSTRSLRSSSAPLLLVPFRRTSFGKRSFSTAAPSVRNSLPVSVQNCDTLTLFKYRLKAHLFSVLLLNCPVRQRLWSHGNMALYKFCIVLYCIVRKQFNLYSVGRRQCGLSLPMASTRVQGWGDEPCEPTVRLPDWSELVASYSRMKSAWGWANGGQPLLVCYIRKYVIIMEWYSRWRPPNQNIGGCPRHPRRGWRQWSLLSLQQLPQLLVTLVVSGGKRNKRVWCPSVCLLHIFA